MREFSLEGIRIFYDFVLCKREEVIIPYRYISQVANSSTLENAIMMKFQLDAIRLKILFHSKYLQCRAPFILD